MNSPVTTSPPLSAAGNRDAAPAGQAARQRADRGDGGDGSDTRFSDLLPARHPASTAPADRADKTGEADAHTHGPKRRQAEQAQDDGSAAALLAAAQAGAAGQPPGKAVDGAAASALAADAVAAAAASLAKAQGGAAQASAGEPAALGPSGDAQTAQAGPASLAQLIHDQLETARPARARAQAQTADESDAAQAGARMAARRAGSPRDDGSTPNAPADAARQAAQDMGGTQAGQAVAHDARAMARHTPQPSPQEKAGKTADAANAVNATNTASAAAAQQAATAGVDASAALPAQAAALASAQATLAAASPDAANPGSTARIGTPLGHPQWAEDFSRQVLVLSSGDLRNQSVKLHVNPPELGPLHIALNINNNVAHAVFASAHAEVRNAIENALPQLQQALAQNGLALGQANVGEQRQFAQEFSEPSGQKKRGAGFTLRVAAPGAAAAVDAAPRRVAGSSLVDTFA